MKKFKEYYDTNEFSSLSNTSIKTLGRLKKRLITENPATRKVIAEKGMNMYHHSLLKEFVSNDIFEILLTNKSLRNTIECLKRVGTLEHYLFHMTWTWFGTVAYKYDLSSDVCFKTMHNIYNALESTYGNKTDIRMFFTTESFSSAKDGNHNHFVLSVSNNKLIPLIEKDIKAMLEGNRIHLVDYDDKQPCIFYNGKEGLQGADWDILGNNLGKEGIPL